MITKNQVFTYLSENIDAYCTQYYEVIPKSLPCVYFRETHAPVRKNITLALDDEQLRMVIYLEVTGQGIDDLLSDIEAVFREMKFVEELCQMEQNFNAEEERWNMRFSRIVAGDEPLTEETLIGD